MIFLSCNCFAQIYAQHDFSLSDIGHVRSEAWYRLDTSGRSFAVASVGGRLQISDAHHSSVQQSAVSNGKLLALDCGEWGGGLYFQPPVNDYDKGVTVDGRTVTVANQLESFIPYILPSDPARSLTTGKQALIAPGNCKSIVSYGKDWLFIQSFSSMKGRYGWLSKLTINGDAFTTTGILDLNAPPMAMSIYKDKVYIATYNSFYCIAKGKKEVVLENLLWEGLSPNSIAVIGETDIYVGILGGYARVNLKKNQVLLYGLNEKNRPLNK